MTNHKKLSNPFSTGGGGAHFEAHIQAFFVILMLARGHAPCLPCWPITEIKTQGKIDGYQTDDLIVFVENPNNQEQRKLLGQVKHSISITKGDAVLGEVLQAAWSDFNNGNIFNKEKDVIALITGLLSKVDSHNVLWLLTQARCTKNASEFFTHINQANFSPSKSQEKLEAIKHHLKAANNGSDLSESELYDFLRHFHLLSYDLGGEFGVVLPLLHSYISKFQPRAPKEYWSRIIDIVQTWNQHAGSITHHNLPRDLSDAFKQVAEVAQIPEKFVKTQKKIRRLIGLNIQMRPTWLWQV